MAVTRVEQLQADKAYWERLMAAPDTDPEKQKARANLGPWGQGAEFDAYARGQLGIIGQQIGDISGREQIATGQIQGGIKTGKEVLPEGSLGRAAGNTQLGTALGRAQAGTQLNTSLGRASDLQVDLNMIRQGTSSEVADIIARRKANLAGMTGEEQQAQRAIQKEQIDKQTETARRRLSAIQSSQGLRGGTAATQQSQVLQAGVKTRAEFERDLFLSNLQMKREALSAYEQSVGAAEKSATERQYAQAELAKFNVGQRAQTEQFNLAQQLRERQLQEANLNRIAEQERFNLGQQLQERQLQEANLNRALEQERFNLAQVAREKEAQIAIGMGQAQLISGDIASDRANQASVAAANAQSSGGK